MAKVDSYTMIIYLIRLVRSLPCLCCTLSFNVQYISFMYYLFFNNCTAEPGRSTLNVLNYKYKYFPSRKYLSTSTLLFGEMYFQNVLKYNQEYISITEQFFLP